MRFQLVADVTDEELFRKAMHELGTIFYRCIDESAGKYEIVYFSGSRVVRFLGAPSKRLCDLVEAAGFEVESIEIDELNGIVKIRQKTEQQ